MKIDPCRRNPSIAAFLGLLIAALVLGACSDSQSTVPPGEREADTQLTGTFEIVQVDGIDPRRSHEEHYLVKDRDWVRLDPSRAELTEKLVSGDTVTLRGKQLSNAMFKVAAVEAVEHFTPFSAAAALQSRNVGIFLANFSNNPTAQPISQEAAKTAIFTGPDSANAFWKEASFETVDLVGAVDPTGDVFGYYTLDATNENCGSNRSAWGTKLEAKAREAGVDLSVYQHLVFVFAAECDAAWGSIGGPSSGVQRTWFGNNWFESPAAHEFGHNFGLRHANSYACSDEANRWVVPISNRCEETEYGDPFDVMGWNHKVHPNVWAKGRLGFLQPSAIATIRQSGTYRISPSFQIDGTPGLRILKEFAPQPGLPNDTAWYYYLEFRQPYGHFDRFTGSLEPVLDGVSIRLAHDHASPALPSGYKTRLIDTTPVGEPPPPNWPTFYDSRLAAGQVFEDPVAGIRVRVLGVSAAGADVEITMPPDPPGNGTGLRGDYFDNANFTAPKLTRTDPTVNFDWNGAAPDPSMGASDFSVRWEGQVLAQSTGEHTFYTTSDDGVRLWVDGTLLIDNWTSHPPTENSARILLNKGAKYAVKLEYYQGQSTAVAKLEWATPHSGRAVIPSTQLFPASGIVFSNGFETGDPPLTWRDAPDDRGGWFQNVSAKVSSIRQEIAHAGLRALLYSGNDDSATTSYMFNKVLDVSIPVRADTELSYFVYPQQLSGTFVAVDVRFSQNGNDHGNLSGFNAVDQFGIKMDATSQGRGGKLAVNTWTQIRCNIGAIAAGKIVDRIIVTYNQPENTGAFSGYIDDIVIR